MTDIFEPTTKRVVVLDLFSWIECLNNTLNVLRCFRENNILYLGLRRLYLYYIGVSDIGPCVCVLIILLFYFVIIRMDKKNDRSRGKYFV